VLAIEVGNRKYTCALPVELKGRVFRRRKKSLDFQKRRGEEGGQQDVMNIKFGTMARGDQLAIILILMNLPSSCKRERWVGPKRGQERRT